MLVSNGVREARWGRFGSSHCGFFVSSQLSASDVVVSLVFLCTRSSFTFPFARAQERS